MTSVSGASLLMCVIKSIPLPSDRRRSVMTRSTLVYPRILIDSAKLSAVRTSKPASLRMRSRVAVTLFSSSTIRILFGKGAVTCLLLCSRAIRNLVEYLGGQHYDEVIGEDRVHS